MIYSYSVALCGTSRPHLNLEAFESPMVVSRFADLISNTAQMQMPKVAQQMTTLLMLLYVMFLTEPSVSVPISDC
jgi:hypothetical protein